MTQICKHLGGIEIYENIWSSPELAISVVEQECCIQDRVDWVNADVRDAYGNIKEEVVRTNLHLGITYYAEQGNKTCQQLHNQIVDLIDPIAQDYLYRHKILGINYGYEYFNILKYSNNQEFKAHVDSLPGSNRLLSFIIYLNDDYQGGELEFINFDLKLKMTPGSLIVFPSYFSHAHIAHPVTTGVKYAIVAWLILQ
jgi:predicted 2-oxoglutarate/Fe(II)-dependent dioxygenase YbiX